MRAAGVTEFGGPEALHIVDVPEELLPHPVPPFSIQPLAENAVSCSSTCSWPPR